MWLQRLAGRLAARLPWLATGHIGRLCDALSALPISPDWTATDIIDTLDARNRSLGLLALPPTSQHHPAALLAHQLTDALTHDINAHQDRITIQAQHQQRVASQQAARVQLRADQDRHLEYLADHTARSRVTAALTAVRVHLRAQTAKTRSRTHSPACPAES